MSLYKISIRGVLARSLYNLSIKALLARLCKRPLGKISVQDRYKSSRCKISGQALYKRPPCQDLCARSPWPSKWAHRRNESDATGPKWQADKPKMTRGFHGRSHKSHFVWKFIGEKAADTSADIVFREPAQPKHKSHFAWKFTGGWPDTDDTTSIEHRALTPTVRTPCTLCNWTAPRGCAGQTKKHHTQFAPITLVNWLHRWTLQRRHTKTQHLPDVWFLTCKISKNHLSSFQKWMIVGSFATQYIGADDSPWITTLPEQWDGRWPPAHLCLFRVSLSFLFILFVLDHFWSMICICLHVWAEPKFQEI